MGEENLFPLVTGDHGFVGQKSLIHHFGGMIRVAIFLQEEDFAGTHGFGPFNLPQRLLESHPSFSLFLAKGKVCPPIDR